MSDRSTKPTPSPRDPTPSPSPYIAPSPGGLPLPSPGLPLPSPSALVNTGLPCPAALSPLSSPPPRSPIPSSPTKMRTPENLKLKKQAKVLETSDEDEDVRTPALVKSKTKPVEKKKTPSRRKSSKAASNFKSNATISDDDSDSDTPPATSKRSSSTSPVKRPKPSPVQGRSSRPSSTQNTPVRGGRGSSSGSLAPPPPAPTASAPPPHHSPLKRSQVNVSSNLHLSADSDDEEEEMPKVAVEKPSPAPDTAKKNSIKNRIFGPMLKGRQGGKGKGKGKGGNNGGITVVCKEEEDTNVVRDKPGSPQLTSPARPSPARPRASAALREVKDSRENSRSSPSTSVQSRGVNGLKDHRDQRAGTARRDSRDVDGNSKSSPLVEREKVPLMRDSRVNRENSFGNGLEDDLDVSPSEDEEEPIPPAEASANSEPSNLVNPASRFSNSLPPSSSRLSPAVNTSPASLKRRPSLIVGIQFDRLGKTLAQFQNRLGRLQQAARLTRKPSNKECWITSGDEKSSSKSGSVGKLGATSNSGNNRKRKVSEGDTRTRQHQPQHRKVTERTVGESRASPALSAGRGSPAVAPCKESPSVVAGGGGVSDARECGDHGEESRERKRRDR